MAIVENDLITKFETEQGLKQIDYNALANLPSFDEFELVADVTITAENKAYDYTFDIEPTKRLTIYYEVVTDASQNTNCQVWLNNKDGLAIKYQAGYPQKVMIVPDGVYYRFSDLNMIRQVFQGIV